MLWIQSENERLDNRLSLIQDAVCGDRRKKVFNESYQKRSPSGECFGADIVLSIFKLII